MSVTSIPLYRQQFGDGRKNIINHDAIEIYSNRLETDVEVLNIISDRINIEILPFQGQQVWNLRIDDRDLTMASVVDTPIQTTDYLRNYGAFLVHCGITAMGGPSENDTHPLHGELPNARYDNVWIECATDENNDSYVELHGLYRHQSAMSVSYEAHPVLRITQGSSLVDVSMSVQNMAERDMDLMYLAHVNFLPVDASEIVASHRWDSNAMNIRASIPSHVQATDEFRMFVKQTSGDPSLTKILEPGVAYDPEIVMSINYLADENGYGHTLQVHPSGTSDYIRHHIESSPKTIRCIQRTPLHQCLGMALPSTAEVEGYLAEKEKGNVIVLQPGEVYATDFSFGALDENETAQVKELIEAITA